MLPFYTNHRHHNAIIKEICEHISYKDGIVFSCSLSIGSTVSYCASFIMGERPCIGHKLDVGEKQVSADTVCAGIYCVKAPSYKSITTCFLISFVPVFYPQFNLETRHSMKMALQHFHLLPQQWVFHVLQQVSSHCGTVHIKESVHQEIWECWGIFIITRKWLEASK